MALLPYRSRLIADVGISLGDEGKGRLIPEVIEELHGTGADVGIVLKVNGGANSGHTVSGLKLNLIPAGVADERVAHLCLGAGVVADPRKLLWELAYVRSEGYEALPRLVLDERLMLSDVCHRLLDLAWEFYRKHQLGKEIRGTTGRGITPAYLDEVGQCQLYYGDFLGPRIDWEAQMRARMRRVVRTIHNVCLVTEEAWQGFFATLSQAEQRANASTVEQGFLEASELDFTRFAGPEPFTLAEADILDAYWQAGQALRANIRDVREIILQTLERGRTVIGEFGQSYWLDKRFGFSPNVTASHTFTPELFQSANIPLQPVHVMGVCKAYDTKVGTHVFHTAIPDSHPLGKRLSELEYGTATGRQRKVGWFDAVEKADALRYGGYHDIVLNKLDALTYGGDWQGGELLICTGYRDEDGTLLKRVPRNFAQHTRLRPLYRQYPGWSEDISGARKWADLPPNAQRYIAAMVAHIVELAQVAELPNLRYVGVGPDPSQIIKDVPETSALLKLV